MVKLQMVKPPNAGSSTLFALGRQIFGHLPVFSFTENQTDLNIFLIASIFNALCSTFR